MAKTKQNKLRNNIGKKLRNNTDVAHLGDVFCGVPLSCIIKVDEIQHWRVKTKKERNETKMKNDLIVIKGNLYSYGWWDEHLQMHYVGVVDIDEDGILTSTCIPEYFTEEEMQEGKEMNLTQKQWVGIVEFFLRNDFGISCDACPSIAENIVRDFIEEPPLLENLLEHISKYLKREGKKE